MKARRTEKVGAAAAKAYLVKAEEFLHGAESSLAEAHWNSAGLGAVHAAISFADAVLASVAGLRSRENDHGVVVTLLDERVAAFDGASRRQLVGLIGARTLWSTSIGS